MFKNFFCILFFALCLSITYSQSNKNGFFSNAYISGELNYRSYGTRDILGFGGSVEVSKDVKKWLGVGLNVGYWSNDRVSWKFDHPFIDVISYQFNDRISELKFSPFVQLFPVNTKFFDIYAQLGLRFGHYNQVLYGGGFSTDRIRRTFDVFIQDVGDKGINIGYEWGLGLRFQINKVIIQPSFLQSNDANLNDFSSLNLKVGLQLD